MRDIRQDLRERLTQVQQQRTALEKQIATLEDREASLKALLQQEEENTRIQSVTMGTAAARANGRYSTPLARFVLRAFTKQDRCSLRELRAAAVKEGFQFGRKSPGRSIHFLLLGMKQNGMVERSRDGTWSLTERARQEVEEATSETTSG
jgi:hypothetical protein